MSVNVCVCGFYLLFSLDSLSGVALHFFLYTTYVKLFYQFIIIHGIFLIFWAHFFFTNRKRSISVSSRSSSDDSLDLPKRRKKSGRRKLDEVERLAEMERQRRQKEAEQKVCNEHVSCN